MDFDLNRPSFVLCPRVNILSHRYPIVSDLQRAPVLSVLVRGRHLNFALFVCHHKMSSRQICVIHVFVENIHYCTMFILFTIIKTMEWAGWAFPITCLPALRRRPVVQPQYQSKNHTVFSWRLLPLPCLPIRLAMCWTPLWLNETTRSAFHSWITP